MSWLREILGIHTYDTVVKKPRVLPVLIEYARIPFVSQFFFLDWIKMRKYFTSTQKKKTYTSRENDGISKDIWDVLEKRLLNRLCSLGRYLFFI